MAYRQLVGNELQNGVVCTHMDVSALRSPLMAPQLDCWKHSSCRGKRRTQLFKRGCFFQRRAGHAAAALTWGHGAAAELSARHQIGSCATAWQIWLQELREASYICLVVA